MTVSGDAQDGVVGGDDGLRAGRSEMKEESE